MITPNAPPRNIRAIVLNIGEAAILALIKPAVVKPTAVKIRIKTT